MRPYFFFYYFFLTLFSFFSASFLLFPINFLAKINQFIYLFFIFFVLDFCFFICFVSLSFFDFFNKKIKERKISTFFFISITSLIFFVWEKNWDLIKWVFMFRLIQFFILNLFFSKGSFIDFFQSKKKGKDFTNLEDRILIIGAGEAAEDLIKDLKINKKFNLIVGMIDDDVDKKNKIFLKISVIGCSKDVKKICFREKINLVIIAIENLKSSKLHLIIDQIDFKKIQVRIIPAYKEELEDKITFENTRDILAEDLIGRKRLYLNTELINQQFDNKTIFVTGAGGSIGSEICRKLLTFPLKKIVCLCRSEQSLYQLQESISKEKTKVRIVFYLGNIRDYERMEEIFKKELIDILFHAAAHKHVPFMEENEKEAIKINIFGTENLLLLSKRYHLKKFIFISTDKAVNPSNVMGVSKKIGELVTLFFNQNEKVNASIVRFGNVIGSRGSVVPLFKKQILSGGPITVTHPKAVRFFMTIREAALLVINTAVISKGGESFILDMGHPIKINELVKKMIDLYAVKAKSDISIVYTGLREGEKLKEELMTEKEVFSSTENPKIYKILKQRENLKLIEAWLKKIKKKIISLNRIEIRQALKEIVPEYRFKKGVVNGKYFSN